MAPAQRAVNDRFEVSEMVDALRQFARLKDCPFDWELASYSKTKRSQGPDREGLVFYAPLLREILRFAPGCFPNFSLLREVFIMLDEEYKVMDVGLVSARKPRLDWASEAADAVRRAMKHLLEIKRSKTTFLAPVLIELIGLVEDGAGRKHVVSDSDGVQPKARALAPQRSDASSVPSVQFCGAFCKCSDCQPEPTTWDVSSASPASPPGASSPKSTCSLTSLAAKQNKDSVSSARGGQKRGAEAAKGAIGDDRRSESVAKRPAAKTMKRPAQTGSYRVVNRATPVERKEAYIMHEGKFVVSLTCKMSPMYASIIEQVRAELESGAPLREQAKGRVSELSSA